MGEGAVHVTPCRLVTCTASLCIKIYGFVQTLRERMRKRPHEEEKNGEERWLTHWSRTIPSLYNCSSRGLACALRFDLFSHSVLQYEPGPLQ